MDEARKKELQENELAKALGESPNFLLKHLNLILLLITFGLLVWVVLNYRAKAKQQNEMLLSEGIGGARQLLQQLKGSATAAAGIDFRRARAELSTQTMQSIGLNTTPADVTQMTNQLAENAHMRLTLATQINASIDGVLAANPNSAQTAIALLTRADMNWHLANLPPVLLSATRPVDGATTRSSSDYLQAAQDDYRAILRDHASERGPVIQSLFALAAISENRGEWDQAIDWYKKIEAEPLAQDFHRKAAASFREQVATIRRPVKPADPAPLPTTRAS
jgi:tetratricopeptide (TPR) repeat protein